MWLLQVMWMQEGKGTKVHHWMPSCRMHCRNWKWRHRHRVGGIIVNGLHHRMGTICCAQETWVEQIDNSVLIWRKSFKTQTHTAMIDYRTVNAPKRQLTNNYPEIMTPLGEKRHRIDLANHSFGHLYVKPYKRYLANPERCKKALWSSCPVNGFKEMGLWARFPPL